MDLIGPLISTVNCMVCMNVTATNSFHVQVMNCLWLHVEVQHGSPSFWDALGAAVRGRLRLGAVAPMRRFTVLSMRPLGAAVVRLGTGMRWRRAHLAWPAPWVPEMCMLVPCRCHRAPPLVRFGFGET